MGEIVMLLCKTCEKQLKGKQKEFCSPECYHKYTDNQNYIWTSDTYGKVTENQMFDIIKWRIGDEYDQWLVTPGVDSQAHKTKTRVVETVVAYKNKKGGFIFRRTHKAKLFHDLRSKIYYETQTVLDLAKMLTEGMIEKDILCHFILHLDLGDDEKNCKTYALQPEIRGWVESLGFEVRFKPFSYSASSVADKYSK